MSNDDMKADDESPKFRRRPTEPRTKEWTPEEMRQAKPLETPELQPVTTRDLASHIIREALQGLSTSGAVTVDDIATRLKIDTVVVRSQLEGLSQKWS